MHLMTLYFLGTNILEIQQRIESAAFPAMRVHLGGKRFRKTKSQGK